MCAKLLVEIVNPSTKHITRKRCKVVESTLIVRKPTKNFAGYTPKFSSDSVLDYDYKPFVVPFPKFTRKKVVLIDGADSCCDWLVEKDESGKVTKLILKQPYWDRNALERLLSAGVVKNSGNVNNKLEASPLILILLALSIGLNFATLMMIYKS